MSHTFILELMEAAGVKFLGTVPASSIKKYRPEDDDEDDDFGLGDPDGDVIDLTKGEDGDQDLDGGQSGNQSGEFDPDLDPDMVDDPQYGEQDGEQDPDADPMDPDADPNADPDADPMGDLEAEPEPEQEQDPDRMGDIRAVKGAHLVYKRQENDGSFKELWIYNIGDHINNAIEVKRAILAGTDIPEGKLRSEDGKQMYSLVTMGNAQMLSIDGLLN